MIDKVEHWVRVLVYFEDAVDQWGETHPEQADKVKQYKDVVMDIFKYGEMGLIEESPADRMARMVDQARKDPKFRREHPDAFGETNGLNCDDPLYDGEEVF